MKRIFLLLALIAAVGSANVRAQDLNDSTLANTLDSLTDVKVDSLFQTDSLEILNRAKRVNSKIDSAMQKVSNVSLELPDSLNYVQKLEDKVDQLKANAKEKLDSTSSAITEKLTSKLTSKKDSVNQLKDKISVEPLKDKVSNLTEDTKLEGIEDQTGQLSDNLNADPLKDKVSDLTEGTPLEDINKQGGELTEKLNLDTGIDEAIPDLSLEESVKKIEGVTEGLDGIKEVEGKIEEVTAVPEKELGNLKDKAGIDKVQEQASEISAIKEEVGGYGDDLKAIKEGNLDEAENIPGKLEEKAQDIDELAELNEQSAAFEKQKTELEKQKSDLEKKKEEYLKELKQYQDPKYIKEQLKDKQMQLGVDHFVGKEKKLQAAKEKLGKIKKKYGSIESTKDLPKIKPNVMKNKSFRERLVYGFYTQIHQNPTKAFDLSPFMGFKVSGIVTTGLGYSYRVDLGERGNNLNGANPVYGYRFYSEVKVYKSLLVHAEFEQLRTTVINNFNIPDDYPREWVESAFIGVGSSYHIKKLINGYMLTLYNMNYENGQSPYNSRLIIRVGIMFGG